MLSKLYIENVALINKLEIDFEKGFNVLTGETGAGKSIIIDAVNLVLGERATKELIKTGADKAKVVAVFDVLKNDAVNAILEETGIECEDELILSRELSMQGKNVCRINSAPVTLAVLKKVSDILVDIHGQHEHQKLMDEDSHIYFLDAFGGKEIAKQKEKTEYLSKRYHEIRKKMLSGFMSEAERERELDILSFRINEIESAALRIGEDEELKEERKLLNNAEKIMNAIESAYYMLAGDKDALSALSMAASEMSSVSEFSKEYAQMTEKLNDVYYAAEDIREELRDMKLNFDFDPSRIDEVEQRIDLLSTLKRKYGGSIESVLEYKKECEKELDALLKSAQENEKYLSELADIKTEYAKESAILSDIRKSVAKELETRLLKELSELGMEKARFEVAFSQKCEEAFDENGMDNAVFMLSANSGEALKGLAYVASGGEMSRIMLSFKTVFADNDDIETMIFDEIDTGISGKVADAVGEKMKKIAKKRQVICVTHLPQIAALSENHHEVIKKDDGEKTVVEVKLLDEDGAVKAIAKMLGGSEFEETALEHARQLVSKK